MRIITRRKIYRAFPELDGLSDLQCRQLMRRIRLSVRRMLIVVVAAAVVLVTSCLISSQILRVVHPPIARMSEVLEQRTGWDWIMLVAFFAGIILGVFISLLLALLARDIVLGYFLKQGMRLHLRYTVCPLCRYQLIGQQVDEAGGLRCPECGRATSLRELGLTGPEALPSAPASQDTHRVT